MMKKACFVGFLVLFIFFAADLAAINRGSASGVVKTTEGTLLAEAKVRISGDFLPAGREFTTGNDGVFRFLSLLPGKYKLEITHAETLDFVLAITVSLDKDTQVQAILTPVGRVTEEVTVTAAAPLIDVKSTEVSTNWEKEEIVNLPLGRSYAALLQLAPGVADNRDFAPNAGANKQDNVYLYDGANITNPHFGFLGANFSELDIQEINIKRGAISAEFGRAVGMVTNAITKSGTNRISGSFRLVAEPASGGIGKHFVAENRDKSIVSKTNSYSPTVGLGGPVIKDRLWWYGSANIPRSKTTGRINNLGSVPDAESQGNEFFLKLNANPHRNHQFVVSFRNRDYKTKNGGVGVNDYKTTATDDEGLDRIFYASWTWIISPNTYLDVKYDHVKEDTKSVPVTDLGYQPTWNPAALDKMGYFRTAAGYIIGGANLSGQFVGGASLYNTQNFFRDEVKAVLSRYLDFRGHSHLIKLGFGYDDSGEYLERIANGWGSITYIPILGAAIDPRRRPGFRAIYWSKQAPQDSRGRTYSFFLQDQATIGDRLTVMAGVLVNRDEFSTKIAGDRKTFLKFDFKKEIQPRLGFTFVLDKKAQDKLYANFGRFNCLDNKSIARAAAPVRLYQNDAYFLTDGTKLSDLPRASETGKVILPDVNPTYQDEFVVGYSRPITPKWVIDVWGQYRYVKNVIEDYPTVNRLTAPTSFVYGNLDGSDRAFGAKATRYYRALNVQVTRPFSDGWSLNINYTLSKLYGNWDLDYAPGSALFYASSALEDGPGLYVNEPNRDGIHFGDRTHVFKLFGTWEFYKRTFFGAYYRFQSGRPWEARGTDYWGGTRKYEEKAGSRRLESWGNLDLQITHTIPLGRFNGVIEARVMNVTNDQVVLSRDNRLIQPTFHNPTSYAPPRRFVLSFYMNF